MNQGTPCKGAPSFSQAVEKETVPEKDGEVSLEQPAGESGSRDPPLTVTRDLTSILHHEGSIKKRLSGVPVVAQWPTDPTGNHEVSGSVPGLALGVKDPTQWVAVSCGGGCRSGSDPALLWLWHRLVAIAPIRPLAWESPYAARAAQEMAKDKKKKNPDCNCYKSIFCTITHNSKTGISLNI